MEISHGNYLSIEDKKRKADIAQLVVESGLPDEIINAFKAVSKIDKIALYKRILAMNSEEKQEIAQFCKSLITGGFKWYGFDTICNIISEFVKEEELKLLMTQSTSKGHILLTAKVFYYLKDGFLGVIENEKSYYKKSVDSAIRNASKMVFNTFRYQLTKYLGIFDLLYRYSIATELDVDIDQVVGINILVQLLEYGSVVEKAKKVNDYGVPYSIVRYYETEDIGIIKTFDAYEKKVFERIKDIL